MSMPRSLSGSALLALVSFAPCAAQDDVLPITSARVTQLVQGLAAEQPIWAKVKAMEDSADAFSERNVAARQQNDERRTKYQDWDACREKYSAPMPPDVQKHAMRVNQKLMALDEQQRTALMRQADEMEKLADDAAKRGDTLTVQMARVALRKMLAQVTAIPEAELAAGDAKTQVWSDQNDARIEKNCGAEPEAAVGDEVLEQRAKQNRGEGFLDAIDRLGTQAGVAGAKASGLSQRQYAILRERIIAFLQSEADASQYQAYKFTDAERTVLTQRRAELSRYADILTRTPSWDF